MHTRTVIAIVIFVALLGLVMMTVFKPQERNLTHLAVPDIESDTVEKIVINADETFELLKEGEQWVLDDGRPADSDMVDRALGGLEGLTSTELVSSNPEKHATYEVDDEKGQRVTVFVESQPVVDVVIGKASTVGAGTYVRLADTDDVYLLQRSPVKSYFASSKVQWQRLKLFDASLADVASLNIVSGNGNEFDLVQNEDKTWALGDMSVLPEGFRFDGSIARSLVSTFLNLRAKEILVMSPDPVASGLGVDGSADTYSLSLQNAVTHTLRLGKADTDEQNYYAQFDEDQLVLIPSFAADNIRKGLNDFRALNIMEFDPNNVMRLSIKSKDGRHVLEKTDGQWTVAEESAQPSAELVLNGATVERSMQELSRVRATSYIANAPATAKAGLSKPAFEIVVTLESGETATLLLGDELKEGVQTVYYASGNADNGTYLVPEHEVAQFTASGFDRWK